MHSKKYTIIGLAVATAALISDQTSKWAILELLDIANRPPIEVTSFFNLVMVWNRGVSFGMFARHDQPFILIAVALVIVAIMLRWLWQADKSWVAVAIGMVIGGALGNVIDRVRFGAVADFFDLHVNGLHWPAFNIADACIFIGVVLLCVDSMFMQRKKG